MKICPQCQSTYTDDSLQFCLQDGTPLSFHSNQASPPPTVSWSESETVLHKKPEQLRIDLPQSNANYNQNAQNPYVTNADVKPPKKSKAGLFIVLVLIVLLGLGGLGAFLAYNYLPKNDPIAKNTNTNQTNSNSVINTNTNTNINTNVNTNVNVATPTPKPTLKPAEIESAKKEVETTLYGWSSSASNHNLDANLANYADTVDYYKTGKLSKSKLKANKEPAYKRYDSIDIDIENIKVTVDSIGEKATVVLDKNWDFAGMDKDGNDIYYRGKVQQQLILNKIGGKWKIVSEKDLKVYNADRNSTVEGDY